LHTNSPNRPIQYGQAKPAAAGPAQADVVNDLDFILHERREAEFEKAVRHTNKVKLLKIALPIVGVLVILGISGALIINSLLNSGVNVDSISVSDGKLVMENPQLNGLDGKQRPYNLSANKAVQDASNPMLVELQEISASLPVNDLVSASINAGKGFYNADAKTLLLAKEVHVVTNNGMSLTLQDADVDIGAGTLTTKNAILATSPQADISAKSLSVHDNGAHLIFEGGVRITLRPDALREGNTQ